MSEATERVVCEESTRTLRQQYELLDGLRGRAGTLLAAASLATAFLSAQALSRHQVVELVRGSPVLHPWSAVGLFCLVVVLTLVVLIPWRWTFSHDPHLLIALHLEPGPPSSIEELYRNLSYWNGVHYQENGRKLQLMLGRFAIACLALAAEMVLWLVLLGSR
jgi:hypothetical protein